MESGESPQGMLLRVYSTRGFYYTADYREAWAARVLRPAWTNVRMPRWFLSRDRVCWQHVDTESCRQRQSRCRCHYGLKTNPNTQGAAMLARCVHPSPHPSPPSLHLDLEYVPYASQTSERRSSIKVAGGIPDDACCRVASVRLARSGKGVQRCHVTVRADLINLSTSVRAVLGCTVKIAHRIFDDATGRVVVLERTITCPVLSALYTKPSSAFWLLATPYMLPAGSRYSSPVGTPGIAAHVV
jgi:hypothetical protein